MILHPLTHASKIGITNCFSNYSTRGKGCQIGVINIRINNPWYSKVLPIFNFKMDNGNDNDKPIGYPL